MPRLPTITVTDHPLLIRLLAYEFYNESDKSFDSSQLEKYINRLTRNQKYILNKSKINEITSFVVYGDGFIERPIGASYVYDDNYESEHITPKINEITTNGICKCGRIATITAAEAVANTLNLDIDILPNASFAIFNKKSNKQVELLFYTRFFVINYYMLDNCAIVTRFLVKQLNLLLEQQNLTTTQETEKEELEQKIFKCMMKIYTVVCSCSNYPAPAGLEPTLIKEGLKSQKIFKYYLSNNTIDQDSEVPYISIVDELNNPIWWMRGGSEWNTIHGTLDTKGCWMIFQNNTWNYDNDGDSEKENYTYFEFLRLFAGMQYNYKNPSITFPQLKDLDKNDWDASTPLTSNNWLPNLVGNICGPGIRWSSLFFFKRIDHFTSGVGDDKEFLLG